MQAKLLRRIQRYGWDLAANAYEPLWQTQLAPAQAMLLEWAALAPGQRVLDVACGTGLVSFPAARAVGQQGALLGVDLSEKMVAAAQARVANEGTCNLSFARMDAEALGLPDACFDAVLCALGLMYMPDPERALREMWRVLRPRGRVAIAMWGERACCGWSAAFPIVDAEVASEVCPMFFRLCHGAALMRALTDARFDDVQHCRIPTTLRYADSQQACDAAFVGGPMALAWSRFGTQARERVCAAYLEAIEPWRVGTGYCVPGEFLVATGLATDGATHTTP
jgi:ubiquinone/menaquinone biosynthesis C-methylase UbiE